MFLTKGTTLTTPSGDQTVCTDASLYVVADVPATGEASVAIDVWVGANLVTVSLTPVEASRIARHLDAQSQQVVLANRNRRHAALGIER